MNGLLQLFFKKKCLLEQGQTARGGWRAQTEELFGETKKKEERGDKIFFVSSFRGASPANGGREKLGCQSPKRRTSMRRETETR